MQVKEIFLTRGAVSNSGLIFQDVTLTVSLTRLKRRVEADRETPIPVSSLLSDSSNCSPPEQLQTCLSPVSILGVDAGSPIKAGVTGVGGAGLVAHFPGSAATHSRGCHLY